MTEALAEAGEQWYDLALSVEAPPSALPLWYASLYDAFGPIDGAVSVHRLYADSQLVAVLPLSMSRGLCRIWRPYQHLHYTLFWAFAFDGQADGAGREICRHLLSTAEAFDFKYMLAHSGPVPHLVHAMDPGTMLVESDPEEADLYNPLNGPWEQRVEHISGSLRRNIDKGRRRLQRLGDLSVSVQTEPDGLERILTECFDLEKAGWKGKAGTAIACLPKTERFYRNLAQLAASEGLLALYTMRLNGKLIAFNFSLRTGRRINALKNAYDETLSSESPGNVLNYAILEWECNEGHYLSYHYGSPTAHKTRWTQCTNPLVRVLAFADSPCGRCCRFAHARLRPLVRRWRQRLKPSSKS